MRLKSKEEKNKLIKNNKLRLNQPLNNQKRNDRYNDSL